MNSINEKQIVENHIKAIKDIIDNHNKDRRLEGKDKIPYPYMPNWVIVHNLLIYRTENDGKMTGLEKCIQIGIDPHRPAFPFLDFMTAFPDNGGENE